MNSYPLTFNIPSNIKELDLIFWIRPFTIETQAKRFRMNFPHFSLYMQKSIPYQDLKALNQDQRKGLSFQIDYTNLYNVKSVFRIVETWFDEENLKELYGTRDDGQLIFNMEYKDLKAGFVDEFALVKQAFQFIPAPIQISYNQIEPGVILYINRKENYIVLRNHQILFLCDFFKRFDLNEYGMLALQSFQYSLTNGNILPRNN